MAILKEKDYGTPAGTSSKQIALEIDGRKVSVPAGTSVMRAALEADIDIPRLCATDSLKPFGSCRLCVVEIEGRNGTPGSCPTEVAGGRRKKTQKEKKDGLRAN